VLRKPTLMVTVVAAFGVAVPIAGAAGPPHPPEPDDRSPLRAESVRLGPGTLSRGPGGSLRTARVETAPYEMLAVTSPAATLPEVQVRTRAVGPTGTWSRWRPLHAFVEHTPRGAAAGDGPAGPVHRGPEPAATELMWVGPSDGVQVRLDRAAPPGTRLRLVHPGVLPSDRPSAPAAPSPHPRDRPGASDPTDAPQPAIHTRAQWGADESWRGGRPTYSDTIKQAHVHHTAATNAYDRADVPAIIRADYWYHTQVLGWSDLGYNFLVDRFGRIWAGRKGSIDRPVQGAHTLGFNHASFGVAVIGNYDTRPPPEVVRALVRLSAWKLDEYDRKPDGHVMRTSHGSDTYAYGAKVRLPVIDGHRDTNQTECPGDGLYAALPEIRDRAQRRADRVFSPGAPKAGDQAPAPAPDQTLG
jgi:hypothetical protein